MKRSADGWDRDECGKMCDKDMNTVRQRLRRVGRVLFVPDPLEFRNKLDGRFAEWNLI